MTVRKKQRRGQPRLIIEIPYQHPTTKRRVRFRRDATVQTWAAAQAEERRYIATLAQLGYIPEGDEPAAQFSVATPQGVAPKSSLSGRSFLDAVKMFRATKALTGLKRTTRRGYDVSFDTYWLPKIGDVPIEHVGFTQFAELDAELTVAGLRPSSRGNVLIAGRSVLRCCVNSGWLADMPKLPRLPKVGEIVIKPPRQDDIAKLLREADPHTRVALALCIDAGLRAGEVRGLEWLDVDLEARVLTVRQTIYYGERDTPKSGHQRSVPLTQRLTAILTEAAKRPHQRTDPVAPSRRGTAWGESSLAHAFRRTLKQLDLPATRLHDLRHYFVTQCFRAGVGAPTVRDLAGHKHMHVTARYAHTDEAAKRAAIDLLDRRA